MTHLPSHHNAAQKLLLDPMSVRTDPKTAIPVPALSLDNVTKIFRNDLFKKPYTAVNQLSMIFPTHACTGLLGHNGAGKTTTIRMLLGLIKPDRGEILFEGEPLKTHHKHHIGYMPEVNKLPLSLTCEEVLRFTLLLRQSSQKANQPWPTSSLNQLIASKLEELGLSAQRHKKVSQLSKGLARRLAFAQATIHQPRLLILDEPTSGLDPAASHLLETLIVKEKARGTTILLCTHDMSHLSLLCDEINLLKRGRLILTSVPMSHEPKPKSPSGTPHRPASLGPRTKIAVQGQVLSSNRTEDPTAALKALQTRLNLPGWSHILAPAVTPRSTDQMVHLEFIDEAAGQRWLDALFQNGYRITQFSRSIALRPDEIYEYYEKDL